MSTGSAIVDVLSARDLVLRSFGGVKAAAFELVDVDTLLEGEGKDALTDEVDAVKTEATTAGGGESEVVEAIGEDKALPNPEPVATVTDDVKPPDAVASDNVLAVAGEGVSASDAADSIDAPAAVPATPEPARDSSPPVVKSRKSSAVLVHSFRRGR